MHPWVWGRMRLYGVQGTQSVRADDEPETRPIIGEEGSTLRLTTTERRLKPRTSPESQPRLGFTGASKKFCPSSFFGWGGALGGPTDRESGGFSAGFSP
jgi:hypothetical protein